MSEQDPSLGNPVRFRVDAELDGLPLNRAIAARVEGLSARAAKLLVDRGRVFVQERRALKASEPVRRGDRVEAYPDRTARLVALGPDQILFHGSGFIAVNKPAGLSVYGTRGVTEGTLAPLLGAHLKGTGEWKDGERLRLVHRLDRDTSGVLLVARNADALRCLEEQFLRREVKKRYLVIVRGKPALKEFRHASAVRPKRLPGMPHPLEKPSHRSSGSGEDGVKEAVTEFRVIEVFSECALVEAMPLTGHTHQIRIHLAQLGTPVLGDALYGSQRCATPISRAAPRQMLHAESLAFRDPDTGKKITLAAPMPDDMAAVLGRLRSGRGNCL